VPSAPQVQAFPTLSHIERGPEHGCDPRTPAVVQPTSSVAAFTLSTASVKAANLFDNEFLLERRHCRLRLGQGQADVARARADVVTVESQ